MCGGGGGGGLPPDNSLELERMRNERDDRLRAEERVRSEDEDRQRIALYNEALGKARTSAASRAQGVVSSRGLDPNSYASTIERAIRDQEALVPYKDPNPGSYFTDDFISNILAQEQSGKRTQYTRQLEDLFPTGFEDQYITDTMDDPFINDILGSQKTNAMLQLDRAKARGNLDDVGYSGATKRIEDLFKAGSATAQQLGGSVLQGKRERLRGIADEAFSKAGAYELGGSFDPNRYVERRDTRLQDLTGTLEGDIRSALSGQNFFDIGDILTQGGITQGASNPRLSAAAVLEQRGRKQDAQRGVGGSGTF